MLLTTIVRLLNQMGKPCGLLFDSLLERAQISELFMIAQHSIERVYMMKQKVV
jgi:hypothetical protein